MASPDLPAFDPAGVREARRLAALHEQAILDTTPEPAFDALTRLAARLFDAPIAAFTLLDADRCWFKAAVGLDIDSIDRAPSITARVVEQALAGGPLPIVIDDLRSDEGSSAHPLRQREPAVLFAAAAPVVDAMGEPLGAMVLLDHRVRTLDETQRALLGDLATVASNLLQARHLARRAPSADGSDPLTGAAHPSLFEQALEVELSHAMRTGEAFAVLRLDVDGFSDINTAYGPAAGDAVLREVGARLRAQVRLGDLFARLGADDFGIVMRHGGEVEAAMLAERITTAVRQPVDLGPGLAQVSPGISVGVATYTDAVASVAELLAQAEASLQQARARKESRWRVFGRFFEKTDQADKTD